MKYIRFIHFLAFFISIGLNAQEMMSIEGAITLQDNKNTNPTPGTIRWTGLNFEGWNGFLWIPLTQFQVSGVIHDINGNPYRTIIIGGQEWMAENLRTSKYKNGDGIPEVINDGLWNTLSSGAFCWINNDSTNFDQPFGKIYNWFAVNDSRGVCPNGWHIPTDSEWSELTNFLGGLSIAGGPIKTTGTQHWLINFGATNTSGFSGLPGGLRNIGGTFHSFGYHGYWWTSTSLSESNSWYRRLSHANTEVTRDQTDKRLGFSVRCLKD